MINAAEYGYQQRRRRIFIFGYKNGTKYAKDVLKKAEYDDAFENAEKACKMER